jgi:hypothetical protein
MTIGALGLLATCFLAVFFPRQEETGSKPAESTPRTLEWKEGNTIRVRVPVASPERELMTTLSFPEERIETAIVGWPEGSITATAKGGLLFLRLPKKAEGHLNVIGGSGTHYLVHLEGVEKPEARSYDAFLKIKKDAGTLASPKPEPRAHSRPKPVGSIELLRAMRLGEKPEGASVLRAKGEVAHRSDRIEVRLLYVYKLGAYVGRTFEIENLTSKRQPIDASRFRASDEILIASGLRENVLEPRATTRLYSAFWKD